MPSGSDKRDTVIDLLPLKDSQPSGPAHGANSSATPPKADAHKNGDTEISRKRKESPPERHPAKRLKKDREVLTVSDDTDPITGHKELQIVEAAKAGVPVFKYVRMKHGSPGERFQKVYKRELDIWVTFAVRTRSGQKEEYVMVKNFSGPDAEEKVHMLQKVRHENFVAFLEYFNFDGCHHIILERMDITAIVFAKSSVYPTEPQLAKVIGQVRFLRYFR
jgi:hypothetical protein